MTLWHARSSVLLPDAVVSVGLNHYLLEHGKICRLPLCPSQELSLLGDWSKVESKRKTTFLSSAVHAVWPLTMVSATLEDSKFFCFPYNFLMPKNDWYLMFPNSTTALKLNSCCLKFWRTYKLLRKTLFKHIKSLIRNTVIPKRTWQPGAHAQ